MPSVRGSDVARALLVALLVIACGPSKRPAPTIVAADSRAELVFENELGDAFVPISLEAKLDGRPWGRPSAGGGEGLAQTVRFETRTVPAGEHEAWIRVLYRGEGQGVFSYLKDYKFRVRSKHAFDAPPHKRIVLTATCYEKGDPTTPLEERPQIRWREEIE